MHWIRIRFKKIGRAKYISHLDLNRVMQRAFRRAHIPIWITQGFNPHPYVVFAMPLSLFYESDCEMMDVKLDGKMPFEEVKERLSAQMPEGIEIESVTEPCNKFTDICFAAYSISLEFAGKAKEELVRMLSDVLSNDTIIVEKSSKRHTVELDIKRYFCNADISVMDGVIDIKATLPAGPAENLNPSCFVSAFEKYAEKPDLENIRRIQIFTADMKVFS